MEYDLLMHLPQGMMELRQARAVFLETGNVIPFDYILEGIKESVILNEKELLTGLEMDQKKREQDIKVAQKNALETTKKGIEGKDFETMIASNAQAVNEYSARYTEIERNYMNDVIRSIATYFNRPMEKAVEGEVE